MNKVRTIKESDFDTTLLTMNGEFKDQGSKNAYTTLNKYFSLTDRAIEALRIDPEKVKVGDNVLLIAHMHGHSVSENLKISNMGGSYAHKFSPEHPYVRMKEQLCKQFFPQDFPKEDKKSSFLSSLFEIPHYRADDEILYFSRPSQKQNRFNNGIFYYAERFDSPIKLLDEMRELHDANILENCYGASLNWEEYKQEITNLADLSSGALKRVSFRWDIDTVGAWCSDYLRSLGRKERERLLNEIEVVAEYDILCKWNGNPGEWNFRWGKS